MIKISDFNKEGLAKIETSKGFNFVVKDTNKILRPDVWFSKCSDFLYKETTGLDYPVAKVNVNEDEDEDYFNDNYIKSNGEFLFDKYNVHIAYDYQYGFCCIYYYENSSSFVNILNVSLNKCLDDDMLSGWLFNPSTDIIKITNNNDEKHYVIVSKILDETKYEDNILCIEDKKFLLNENQDSIFYRDKSFFEICKNEKYNIIFNDKKILLEDVDNVVDYDDHFKIENHNRCIYLNKQRHKFYKNDIFVEDNLLSEDEFNNFFN